eukprot:GILI01002738.1.p1 GENE.GILI01002738.1~~GILI01002738.1.p1  ORF type:complete len:386 (-),score=149.05 GILI01002738.1:388-1545(-)
MVSTRQLTLACYGSLAAVQLIAAYIETPIHIQMLIMTSAIIYIGSHRSLGISVQKADNSSVPINQQQQESLSSKDAWMFPVIGSAVLFSLYVLFKVFPKEWINFVLSLYFSGIGSFAVAGTLHPLISLVAPAALARLSKTVKFSVPSFLKQDGLVDFTVDGVQFLSLIVGAGVGVLYLLTSHWALTNLLGIAFSLQGLEHISLGSFRTGTILLSGLFIYDIFWVFGTDVMVTVARSFDAPVKLLFPKVLQPSLQLSMLGLGDIVIPGIFVALCLRFDHFLAKSSPSSRSGAGFAERLAAGDFSKPYFTSCMVGYVLGLAATIIVMFVFQHAQPALLYLVPGCLGSVLVTGLSRKELKQIWAFDEGELDGKKDDDATQPKPKASAD